MNERKQYAEAIGQGFGLGAASVLTVQLVAADLHAPPYRLSWGAVAVLLAEATVSLFVFRKWHKKSP